MSLADQVKEVSTAFHEAEDREYHRFSKAERFALAAIDAAELGQLVLAAELLRVATEIHPSFAGVRL